MEIQNFFEPQCGVEENSKEVNTSGFTVGNNRYCGLAMRHLSVILLGVSFFIVGPSESSANEIDDLRELLTDLQAEVQALRGEVAELKQERSASDNVVASGSSSSPVSAPVASTASSAPTVAAKNKLEWYGFVKVDAFHDSATTSHQDIPYWAILGSEGNGETDFTARQSRFGFNVANAGDVMGGSLSGKIEMDFFGKVPVPSNLNENHAYQLRSRHIYMKWTNDQWDLLAGKTSQIYDVAVPDTVNFGYLNFQGRLGHRRMQFQGTRKFDLASDRKLAVTVALEEPVGGVHGGDIDGNGIDDATTTEIPTFTSRVRYDFKGIGNRKSYFSLANLVGREEVFGREYDSFATVLGGVFPLTDSLKLSGSIWQGKNLDGARGGIGQGINVLQETEIDASGGWAQLRFQPDSNYWFNVGYSVDNPEDADLNVGQRSENETYLLNGYYKLAEKLILGVEYFQVETDYKGLDSATNHRIQSSFIYKF